MDIEDDGFVTVVGTKRVYLGTSVVPWFEGDVRPDDAQATIERMADLIAKVQNGGTLIAPGKHDSHIGVDGLKWVRPE